MQLETWVVRQIQWSGEGFVIGDGDSLCNVGDGVLIEGISIVGAIDW